MKRVKFLQDPEFCSATNKNKRKRVDADDDGDDDDEADLRELEEEDDANGGLKVQMRFKSCKERKFELSTVTNSIDAYLVNLQLGWLTTHQNFLNSFSPCQS